VVFVGVVHGDGLGDFDECAEFYRAVHARLALMATDSVMLRFGFELLAAVALVGFIGFVILLIMRS
jgi:hypothetical protein